MFCLEDVSIKEEAQGEEDEEEGEVVISTVVLSPHNLYELTLLFTSFCCTEQDIMPVMGDCTYTG